MELQWSGDGVVAQLFCKIKLDGAKPPRNYFTLRYYPQFNHYPSMQQCLKRKLNNMSPEVHVHHV